MASSSTRFGYKLWAPFNNLQNSSTRTEVGALRVACSRSGPVHIATDNATTVGKANQIIEHLSMRERWVLTKATVKFINSCT